MNSIISAFHYSLYTQVYFYSLVFIFGAIVGSFLNVVVFRLFSGESIVLPPSHCNNCGEKIKWYDNIPIFSYFVLLQGKCRFCKEKISIQYPVVEFICALLFLFVFMKYEFSWQTLFLMYFVASGIVMCATDFREQVVFDAVSIPVIPIGLIYAFFNIAHNDIVNIPLFNFIISEQILSSIGGIILAVLFFEGICLISKILIKQRAFGEGDTIIAMGIGAWFGIKALILTVILAFIIQAICVFPLMLYNFYKRNDKKSIFNFCSLLACPIILFLANWFGLMNIFIVSVIISVLVLGAAIFLLLNILKKLRDNEHEPMAVPFGPALITGAFCIIFFQEFFVELIDIFMNYIG